MEIKVGYRVKIKEDWRNTPEYMDLNYSGAEEDLYGIPVLDINPYKVFTVSRVDRRVDDPTTVLFKEDPMQYYWPISALDIVGI